MKISAAAKAAAIHKPNLLWAESISADKMHDYWHSEGICQPQISVLHRQWEKINGEEETRNVLLMMLSWDAQVRFKKHLTKRQATHRRVEMK